MIFAAYHGTLRYKSLIGGEQYEPDEERTNWNQHGWNPLLLMVNWLQWYPRLSGVLWYVHVEKLMRYMLQVVYSCKL